jgi:hypothetical protein
MSDTSPRMRSVLWFVGGILCAGIAFFVYVNAQRDNASRTQTNASEAQQRTIVDQQRTISQLQGQLQQTGEQKDACTAKFQRATILYDEGLLGSSRAWFIPADVEPRLAPNKRGSFSHYDPKTQTETVKFQPKAE